jgi:hypothetical protein
MLASTPGQPRKFTFVETIAPLLGNAIYTGQWHDSQTFGELYVLVTVRSAQAGTQILVQLSDDITNANFVFNADAGGVAVAANATHHYPAIIRARYWRVVYQNGATATNALEITCCISSTLMGSYNTGQGAESAVGALVVQPVSGATVVADNNTATYAATFIPQNGATGPVSVFPMIFGGAFSGTASATVQGSSKARTCTVFKQANITAAGSTAVWTPGANNKFRLLKYRIVVSASAIFAVAADITIQLLDAAANLGHNFIVRIPAAALGSGVNWDSGVCDLGQFGQLSAAANNVLNGNLSAALTGGSINIQVWGTEE